LQLESVVDRARYLSKLNEMVHAEIFDLQNPGVAYMQ
jgi:hypothetical protein